MAKELDINRDLINIRFNSYRLCSDVSWPIESTSFAQNYGHLQTLELGQNDYSYVHVSMVSNINNIYQDPSLPSNIYFITRNGLVICGYHSTKNQSSSSALKLEFLFQIPDYDFKNTYASLAFVSKCRALILRSKRYDTENFASDLIIVRRSFNHEIETWNLESIFIIETKLLYLEDFGLKQSSHMHLFNTGGNSPENSVTFLFGSINKLTTGSGIKSDKNKFKSSFCTVLHLITLEKIVDSKSWTLKNYRRLAENGPKSDWPKYLALYCGDDLYSETIVVVVSEGRMKFSNIIENGIQKHTDTQNELQPSQTTSNTSSDFGQQDFIIEKPDDEDISNFNLELEECDLHDFYDSLVMTIFEGNSGIVLTEYNLTSYQWICSIPNSNKLLPFFVMRHDVDAFIYELQYNNNERKQKFQCKHVGVFDALGYIQASKTKKRFITIGRNPSCKNEWSYAVIADSDQSIYIYWKQTKEGKNGNHKIVQLSNPYHNSTQDFIQGLASVGQHDLSSLIYVLTNDSVNLIRFKSES